MRVCTNMCTYLLVLSPERRHIPNYNDWLSDGRREVEKRLEDGDEEYREYLKEEYPYFYWKFEFTPDPPEEIAEELGLE